MLTFHLSKVFLGAKIAKLFFSSWTIAIELSKCVAWHSVHTTLTFFQVRSDCDPMDLPVIGTSDHYKVRSKRSFGGCCPCHMMMTQLRRELLTKENGCRAVENKGLVAIRGAADVQHQLNGVV